MNPTDIQDQLMTLLQTIQADTTLSEELKDTLVDLVTSAAGDPTPENLEALAIVLKKVSDSNKYMGHMMQLQNIQLDAATEESSTAPQES